MAEIVDQYERLRSLRKDTDFGQTTPEEWQKIKDEIDKINADLMLWAREAEPGMALDKVCFSFEYPLWRNNGAFRGYFEGKYPAGHLYSLNWMAAGRLFGKMVDEGFDVALASDLEGGYLFRMPRHIPQLHNNPIAAPTPYLAIARGCAFMLSCGFRRSTK